MTTLIQNSFPHPPEIPLKKGIDQFQHVIARDYRVIPVQSVPRNKRKASNNLHYNVPVETTKSPSINPIFDPLLVSSCRYRNVFKSIIRHMHACVLNRKEEYVTRLEKEGFMRSMIERAISRISGFKAAERKNGKRKTGMNMIKQAAKVRSVFTYILKDALDSMITNWHSKELGRMAERNLKIYKTVCIAYSKSIEQLLNNEKF